MEIWKNAANRLYVIHKGNRTLKLVTQSLQQDKI